MILTSDSEWTPENPNLDSGMANQTAWFKWRVETALTSIDYHQLKQEHTELMSSWASAHEIALWTWEKLDIASWKAGEFHGTERVLSTPSWEELQRLIWFLLELGLEDQGNNGGSDNHPGHFLIQANAVESLFGRENTEKMQLRLRQIAEKYNSLLLLKEKAALIWEHFGVDILNDDDWEKLTGVRWDNTWIEYPEFLIVSSTLHDGLVMSLTLNHARAEMGGGDDTDAYLCILGPE